MRGSYLADQVRCKGEDWFTVVGKDGENCEPGFGKLCYSGNIELAKELLDGVRFESDFKIEQPRNHDNGTRIFIDLVSPNQTIRPAVPICDVQTTVI